MAFTLPPPRRRETRLSIACAPYLIRSISGRERFCANIREILESFPRDEVESVYDRKANRFLDMTVLWTSRRRKYIPNEKRKTQ